MGKQIPKYTRKDDKKIYIEDGIFFPVLKQVLIRLPKPVDGKCGIVGSV